MKSVVFLIGYLCLGPIDDKQCVNMASQYLYQDVPNCQKAREDILDELDNIDGEEWCGADHECHTWKEVYDKIVAHIR